MTLLERIEGAATSTVSQPGLDGTGDEVEVLKCVSPESGQDSGSQPPMTVQDAQPHPSAGRLLQHVQHSKAEGDNWRTKPVDSFDTAAAAGDEEVFWSGTGGVVARARQPAASASCRGDKAGTASEPEELQPRPRQVSRRGRGRGRGRGRAVLGKPPGMLATLDSDRFGFVKLPSLRYVMLTWQTAVWAAAYR